MIRELPATELVITTQFAKETYDTGLFLQKRAVTRAVRIAL